MTSAAANHIGFVLKVLCKCPACANPLPIVSLSQIAYCTRCATESQLSLNFWQERFGRDEFAEAMGLDEGEGRQINMMGGELGGGTHAYGKRMPRCQECKDFVPSLSQLAAAVPAGGLACQTCNSHIRVREPDDLVRKVLPEAKYVVHEGAGGKAGGETHTGTQPVVFQCMQCAAAIKVDGSARMVDCTYCSASNYLPDGLWLRLHPVQKVEVFFIVAELDEASRRDLRYQDEEARQADAALPGLPRESYALFAADEEEDTRKALAGNPDVPPDLLATLAQDDEWEVRAALAGNPATPANVLKSLADDSDSDVKTALAGNPKLPPATAVRLCQPGHDDIAKAILHTPVGRNPEVIAAMVASSNWGVRQVVARSSDVTDEQLRKLGSDSDSDVRQTAQRHQRWEAVKPALAGLTGANHVVMIIIVGVLLTIATTFFMLIQ